MSDAQRQTRQHRGTVSVQEAADLLGVTRRTVHRWQAQGRMPPRVVYGRRPQYRRLDIFDMMQAGQDDEQIKTFMVDRYGDFVLYSPPMQGNTIALYAIPIVLLGGGAVALFFTVRNRNRKLAAQQREGKS